MQSGEFEALGTFIYVSLPEASFNTLFPVLKNEAERIEAKFSRFLKHSTLSQLNGSLNQFQPVDEEFYALLWQANTLQIQTQGALNFGVTNLLEHWGYDAGYNLKRSASIKKIQTLKIDLKSGLVRISSPLDFGCFGKGYFLDQAVKILQKFSIETYRINAGGDLVSQAPVGEISPKLFLEDPRLNLRVIGETRWVGFLASSSPSKRKWGDFHHLVDPKISAPAFDMTAVYVQHKTNGLVADALSTAFFAMGFEAAVKAWPELNRIYSGMEGMFISASGEIWRSPDFEVTLYHA